MKPMKANFEIRHEARKILSSKWFFRLLLVFFALQTIASYVNSSLASAFSAMSITLLPDFLRAKSDALSQGCAYALPTIRDYLWMFMGFSLQMFLLCIFMGIFFLGFSRTLLLSRDNDESHWFSTSFRGFQQPLNVAALFLMQSLLIFLWSLLLVIPGIIAYHRYQQVWFIKAEHEEMSSLACLRESARLMRGYKWRAFLLDLSFVGYILLAIMPITIAGALGAQGAGAILLLVGLFLVIRIQLGRAVSHAIFYRELTASQTVTDGSAGLVADIPAHQRLP